MEGKRKRRSNLGSPSTSSSSTTPTRKGQESPRVPPASLSGKRKLMASEDERSPAKRGRKSAMIKPGENLHSSSFFLAVFSVTDLSASRN